MIGTRVALRLPRPTGALWCIGVAVAAAALGIALRQSALVMCALLPIAVGLSLLLGAHRRFQARFLPDGFQTTPPPQSIAYSSMLEVRPVVPLGTARPRTFAIEVVHVDGSLLMPADLTVASERVYMFLRDQLPGGGAPALPATLEEYRREQETSFGAEKVWSFGPRNGPYRHRSPSLRAAARGVFAAGLLWLVLPFLRPEPGWFVAGVVTCVAALVLFVMGAGAGRGRPARSRIIAKGAAMVVSPIGVAVQQGALSGHLGWQQIRKVSVRAKATGLENTQQPAPAIVLEVEGATIPITDSYDRPLADIHERILRYWR